MLLQMALFHSFLWISNIPLCIHIAHLLYPFIFAAHLKLTQHCESTVKVKVAQSCLTLCIPMDYTVHGMHLCPFSSPGQNTGVGSCSLLQGIFPTQGSNPGLPCCRRILYQLSHQGSPRILSGSPIPSPGALPDPGIESGC